MKCICGNPWPCQKAMADPLHHRRQLEEDPDYEPEPETAFDPIGLATAESLIDPTPQEYEPSSVPDPEPTFGGFSGGESGGGGGGGTWDAGGGGDTSGGFDTSSGPGVDVTGGN